MLQAGKNVALEYRKEISSIKKWVVISHIKVRSHIECDKLDDSYHWMINDKEDKLASQEREVALAGELQIHIL